MKILAVDYGLKRIGLAYSEGEFAQPLGTLVVKSPIDALEKLLRTAHTYSADVIVMGLPEPDSIQAHDFGIKLNKISQIPVEFLDETMTSVEALDKLKTRSQKKRKTSLDSFAASLILNSYLERLTTRR